MADLEKKTHIGAVDKTFEKSVISGESNILLTDRQKFFLNRLSQIKERLEESKRKFPDDKQGQMWLNVGIFALRRDLIETEEFTPEEVDERTPAKPDLPESGIILAINKTPNNAPKSK